MSSLGSVIPSVGMCQRLLIRFLILTPASSFSAMNSTPALSRLNIVFQPLAPSVIDPDPFSRVAGYFKDEQLVISPDVRFQLVSYLAR